MEPKRELWMRVGCTFQVTPEEADTLMSPASDPEERRTLLWRLMLEGNYAPDGETYIPGESVQDYNERYDTEFLNDDIEFDL